MIIIQACNHDLDFVKNKNGDIDEKVSHAKGCRVNRNKRIKHRFSSITRHAKLEANLFTMV